MPSRWGRDHGDLRYDQFRLGLTFKQARQMTGPNDGVADDRERHRRKRRRGVLGYLHELKLVAYCLAFPRRTKLRAYLPEWARRELERHLDAA